ncbi:MAG: hypothetical protein PHU85_10240, partial [Phycisphaerae bacterium]|nr:hypothetical protein [Phycisphaerae bacterium]
ISAETAEAITRRRETVTRRVDEAEMFLSEALADGQEHRADEITAEAEGRGLGDRKLLWRAGQRLGVRRKKLGEGGWMWQLPECDHPAAEQATGAAGGNDPQGGSIAVKK